MQRPALLSFKSRNFWVLFLTMAAVALFFAMRLMFLIDPGLNLNISFSREQALQAASEFQQQHFPDLQTERSAAAFIKEQNFQNYIELEGGGLDTFQELIPQLDTHTHYWRVRLFSQGQKHELTTEFSPQGTLAGFTYSMPNDESGAALDSVTARSIAEQGLSEFLEGRYNNYELLETNETQQSGGRIDHLFVYENQLLQPGEARLRIRVQVAGDQLSSLRLSKYIPEAFNKRFEELRELNSFLSTIANGMMAIIGLVFLLGGALWLHKRHQLLWKQALICGFVLSTGMAIATFCNLPINWMNYRTDTAEQTFLISQLGQAVLICVLVGFIFAAVFSVAEGLTRHAFAAHPRIWNTFERTAAASAEGFGRILGAYGWTGFFLLYAVLFVLFSTTVLGWWQPSTLPVDPNILASWRPALTPIFNALQAGTWEECFFRAIPLAAAALLDRRFGTGKKILIFMLFAQAIIFAAAHANYPQIPGYSRLIELFVPAMAFGLVYLRFGLIPCMLTHFLYDLLLMSMPIFLADTSGLWLDRGLILLVGFAPLLFILYARYQAGQFSALPETLYNGEQPAPEPAEVTQATSYQQPEHVTGKPLAFNKTLLGGVAILAIAVMVLMPKQGKQPDWPDFQVTRSQAMQIAEQALQDRNIQLEGEWHSTARIQSTMSSAVSYVVTESGFDTAQQLTASYLIPPFWVINWKRFDGPVEERTELWQVQVDVEGNIRQIIHNLPEAAPGASLSQSEAEALALDYIRTESGLTTGRLEVKSTTEVTRPARSDWTVTLLDKQSYKHEDASAMVVVYINGDQVRSYGIGIDVPEEWSRQRNEEQSDRQKFQMLQIFAILGLVGCALAPYFQRDSGRRFSFRAALPWLLIIALPLLTKDWLTADSDLNGFKTAEDWQVQLLFMIGLSLLGAAAAGMIVFLAAQAVHAERPAPESNNKQNIITGVVLGLLILAASSLNGLIPSQTPSASVVTNFATGWPVLYSLADAIAQLGNMLIILIAARGLAKFINNRTRLSVILLLACGTVAGSTLSAPEHLKAFITALIPVISVSVAILLTRRQQFGVIIIMLGTVQSINKLRGLQGDYPDAWLPTMVALAVSLLLTYLLYKHWLQHSTAGNQ